MLKAVSTYFLIISCLFGFLNVSHATENAINTAGKRIFYVDSYHEGYEWSDSIVHTVRDVLQDKAPQVELQVFYMDSKRGKPNEATLQATALKARDAITQFHPDVLIACDDNAVKYLVKPYYKDVDLPVLFCGVNWDAGIYELPYHNATGMLEISLLDELTKHLAQYAKGNRIGYLAESQDSPKNVQYAKKLFDINYEQVVLAKNIDEWKAAFLALQDKVDMLILGNFSAVEGLDKQALLTFILTHQKIPTGTEVPWIADYSLLAFAKLPEEQGEWVANTALDILQGQKIDSIPITRNSKGRLYINLKIGNQLRIAFAPALLKTATLIK
ncbi:ABC-type uncharacterized transport system, periplasmic component [Beggiatoa alba B18LD]|uniref:ABC-type uncharacterized transport system, periplasmic component n=1 Tax=Beggiatoa alba B18LD TaxID=395493 RepID=I3CDG5_9GAMM|nr:ABC transporter substrate binding protein [Beggiatoa alba]EIJ41658.1 ABC-type uncharacterized transport system, periplasmic component [Beggiatoa alba B18LD]